MDGYDAMDDELVHEVSGVWNGYELVRVVIRVFICHLESIYLLRL